MQQMVGNVSFVVYQQLVLLHRIMYISTAARDINMRLHACMFTSLSPAGGASKMYVEYSVCTYRVQYIQVVSL